MNIPTSTFTGWTISGHQEEESGYEEKDTQEEDTAKEAKERSSCSTSESC